MQMTISELSKDPEALVAYIEENELHYVEVSSASVNVAGDSVSSEDIISENSSSDVDVFGNTASQNEILNSAVSENTALENAQPKNQVSGNAAFKNAYAVDGETQSTASDNEFFDEGIPDNTESGNTISEDAVSGNLLLKNTISGNLLSDASAHMQICASYEETIRINKADKQLITDNEIDFSEIKIACLGDSITAATNLAETEDYEKSSYPYQLGEILGAKEVVNLGIGGSTIGRYWENAFVDRYTDIPKDTDLIIVMGGTNDGFCATRKEVGKIEEKASRTMAGDLDELLRGLKKEYPDAVIVLATPLPNVLHDMLRKNNNKLLQQAEIVNVMLAIAKEHEVPVIDLYHSGILDTHDAAVIHNFMPDGVHGNAAGYRILAEHMAAELISLYENQE